MIRLSAPLGRGETTVHLEPGHGVRLGDVLIPGNEYERMLVVTVVDDTRLTVVRGQHQAPRPLPVGTYLNILPEPEIHP